MNTRFSVVLAVSTPQIRFSSSRSIATKIATQFRGYLPFASEDFGQANVSCVVHVLRKLEDSIVSDGDYFAIAQKEPGAFFKKHRTESSIGRLLMRSDLVPLVHDDHGELGPAVEVWLFLEEDDWRDFHIALLSVIASENPHIQLEIECKTNHQSGTRVSLEKRLLVISEDEEYPIVGFEFGLNSNPGTAALAARAATDRPNGRALIQPVRTERNLDVHDAINRKNLNRRSHPPAIGRCPVPAHVGRVKPAAPRTCHACGAAQLHPSRAKTGTSPFDRRSGII